MLISILRKNCQNTFRNQKCLWVKNFWTEHYTSSFILCISIPCSAIGTFWCIFQKVFNSTNQVVLETQILVLKPCASSYQRMCGMHPNILAVWSVCFYICVHMYVYFHSCSPNLVTLKMKWCSVFLQLCTLQSLTNRGFPSNH